MNKIAKRLNAYIEPHPFDSGDILTQRKPNQQEKISFRTEDMRKFFPKSYTTAQMQDVILRLLEGYQRQRQRSQER